MVIKQEGVVVSAAIEQREHSLDHRELRRRVDAFAGYLLDLGLRRGDIVATYLEPSIELVIAMFATMRAGGVYLPIERVQPAARVAFLLTDSCARFVVAEEGEDRLPVEIEATCIGPHVPAPSGATPLPETPSPEDPAYVIYTSGSTGRPKGVVITHAGIANTQAAAVEALGISSGDRVLQFASVGFDASIWEICTTLLHGATLVIPPRPSLASPADLSRFIREHRVTVATLPPAFISRLDFDAAGPTLRLLISAGSALSASVARLVPPHVSLFNAYGPTEASICATMYPVQPDTLDGPWVPIGRPIANTTAHILDDALEPVPVGVPGELYLGGLGVAQGYLHRPELTAQLFVHDPFSEVPGARLYRTGDICRWLPSGDILFQGRRDFQVKLRGVRIECGEVEAVLREHPAVADAVVQLYERAVTGPQLVGYYVPSEGMPAASSAELRAHLRASLPDAMVPGALVALESLPLTRNGKVDRDALPVPSVVHQSTTRRMPSNEAEAQLASIFAELLGVPDVGVEDGFFALGGHSLLAAQVVARASVALGVDLKIADLFEHPTVAGLARCAASAGAKVDPGPTPVPHPERLPLSFAQRRMWFYAQLAPDSTAYHIPVAFALRGELRPDALQAALTALVARHPALRTRFLMDTSGEPYAVIDEPVRVWALGIHAATDAADALALMTRLSSRPFELSSGQPFRADLIASRPGHHWLLLEAHHIVFDGWSVAQVCRELSALYRDPNDGFAPALDYVDFALWQQSRDYERARAYWLQQLGDVPSLLQLPTDRPRPAFPAHAGNRETRQLSDPVGAAIEACAQAHDTTAFVLLLSVFEVLLYRYSGQRTFVVGTPAAGRLYAAVEDVVGLFVNMLCVRADLRPEMTFAECLQQTRRAVLEALVHQEMPFDALVEELAPERAVSHTPLFQVTFAYQDLDEVSLTLPDVRAELVELPTTTSKFDLSLSVRALGGEYEVTAEYDTALFDGATIQRMLDHYLELLGRFVEDTARRVDVDFLPAEERRRILFAWNDTATVWPDDTPLLDCIEAHAAAAPEHPCVLDAGGVLTYGELRQRAAEVATWVLDNARRPAPAPVLVLVERSAGAVVAVLGALWAGRPYLPVDAQQPLARIRAIIDDAQPAAILTLRRYESRLEGVELPVLCVDVPQAPQTASPPAQNSGDDIAYIIYTSGSTGTPKGSALTHRGLLNLARWHLQTYDLSPRSRTSLLASPSFDASVWEVWPTLMAGATLVVADEDARRDPAALVRWLEREAITHSFVPTALMNLLLANWPEYTRELPALQALLTGGDVLRHDLPPGAPFRLFNHYGPTENTVVTTWTEVHPGDGVPAIGRPIANHRVYVLDEDLKPTPIGVPGEICIAGDGVSPGYVDRPALNAQKFVPDPFGADGARLFRTGDQGRWRADGQIEFLGRLDQQVKIRGFRVECGDIEAALTRHSSVGEAVVVVHTHPTRGAELVAYVVPASGEVFDADTLRAHLAEMLPAYMVPAAFVTLDALPTTPSGKVDRRHLPAPTRTGAPPTSEQGRYLAALWEEVLGVDSIGPDDDFFAAGGHSLLATRLLVRVREVTGVELSLASFFAAPTLSAMDKALREATETSRRPLRALRPYEYLPLGYTQLDFWFVYLGTGNPWNLAGAWRWKGEIDTARLLAAINHVVQRETIFWMRTSRWVPRQQLLPARPLDIPLTDLTGVPEPERADRVQAHLEALAAEKLDPGAPPVCRFHVIQQVADEVLVGYCFSHLSIDGAGIAVFQKKLSETYDALALSDEPLRAPDPQIADYVAWERELMTPESLVRARDAWCAALASCPPLRIPRADGERPLHRLPVSPAAFEALRATARNNNCGLQAVMMTLLARAIGVVAGVRSVCVTVIMEARSDGPAARLIAPVMRELPVPIDANPNTPLDVAIAATRSALNDAMYRSSECPWIIAMSQIERSRWRPAARALGLDLIGGVAGRAVARLWPKLQLYPDFLRDYLAFLPAPGRIDNDALLVYLNLHPNIFDEPGCDGVRIEQVSIGGDALPEWVDGALGIGLHRTGAGEIELVVRGPRLRAGFYDKLCSQLSTTIEEEQT